MQPKRRRGENQYGSKPLGIGLAMQGKKVLLVDADPQGNLTTCLGWQDADSLQQTLSNKLSAIMREEQQDPFANKFPKNTKLYKLMTTKPGESA